MSPHVMTPNAAYHAMRDLARQAKHDPDRAHGEANKLLCQLLRGAGYHRAVEVFQEMNKKVA